MKQLLIFYFFLSSISVEAQSYDIEWSELEAAHGRLVYLLPDSSDNFYALRWSGGRILGRYQISRHENLQQVDRAKVSITVKGSVGTFEGARIIGGKLITFLSDRRGDERIFVMQEYSDDLEPQEEKQLAAYEVDKFVDRGWFDIITSSNKKYFAVVWQIPGKKDDKDRYGFKIFNTKLELINEGDYRLPFPSELSIIQNHHVSDKGEYFLSVTEYQLSEKKGLFRNNNEFKAVHIFHIAKDGLQDFILNFDGERIEAMAVTPSGEDELTITGLYGPTDSPGVTGVFYQRVNLTNGDVIIEGFKEFSQDFITQDWSEREIERAERREDRGKGEPQLYNYMMREAIVNSDGSIVGTMEQYYVQVSSSSAGQTGQMSNVYNYYYNDIIAYKINPEGEFEWVNKVNKYQVSTNDGGPYSSYQSFVDQGKIYFIFNDNATNYNEEGDFLDPDRISAATYSKRKNVVALASIDLETGEQSRTSFFDRSEIDALVVPKLFDVNYKTGEMLIYATWGRKEKIGLLRFKN